MFSAADDARAGIPVRREPYPAGEKGIRKSIKEMCQMTREGAGTAMMQSFAGNALRQAGFPRTVREKVTAFKALMHQTTGYAQDPPGTEKIQKAAITLCVPGALACIPIGDCDDLTVAGATLCAAAGMEVEFVRQFFGDGQQEHVLVEVRCEDGTWFPFDASTPALAAGQKARASRETRHSPWDAKMGFTGPEFIGIGALPVYVMTERGWAAMSSNMTLGAPAPDPANDRMWVPVGSDVEASVPIVTIPTPRPRELEPGAEPFRSGFAMEPSREPARGLLAGLMAQPFEMPKLSTKSALAAGAAIVLGSVAVAATIRKLRSTR